MSNPLPLPYMARHYACGQPTPVMTRGKRAGLASLEPAVAALIEGERPAASP